MSDRLVIRVAHPVEYDQVGELTVDAYLAGGLLDPDSSYIGVLRDAADRGAKTDLLVADLDGEIVGAVAYCPPGSAYAELTGPGEAELRMLAVAEGARGNGVGRALVQECIDRARAAGLVGLRLSTQPNMLPAQRMYGRMGFVRTPQRDWSPVPGVDLITYALTLAARPPAPQIPPG